MKQANKHFILIELIIVLLFFCIAATVTVQLFAAADNISNDSAKKSQALLCAQDLTEQIRGVADPMTVLDTGEHTTQGHFWYFDQNWQPTTKAQQVYAAKVLLQTQVAPQGNLYKIEVSVIDAHQKVLCELQISQYQPGGNGQ